MRSFKRCRFLHRKPKTNAERLRSMTDDELAFWLHNFSPYMNEQDEAMVSIYNIDTGNEEEIPDNCKDIKKWLNSKANR